MAHKATPVTSTDGEWYVNGKEYKIEWVTCVQSWDKFQLFDFTNLHPGHSLICCDVIHVAHVISVLGNVIYQPSSILHTLLATTCIYLKTAYRSGIILGI